MIGTALGLIYGALAGAADVGAAEPVTLADLASRLSWGSASLHHARVRDGVSPVQAPDSGVSTRGRGDSAASPSTAPDVTDQRGFTVEEVIDPIPLTSSVTREPTYEQRADGTYNAYVRFKGILVLESGLPLFTRVEWPIPEIDDISGPTNVGVGDLSWLTLFVAGSRESWGTVGIGPVWVFPTASHSEMGQGKYQLGPALGYVTDAVPGWQFAFLLQHDFSFAGDPQRSRVNQLTLQPFVTKLLPASWYLQTQPAITLDFVHGTSSVPLNLTVGRLFAGRWNVSVQATVFPHWTSAPSNDYELRLSIGYHLPSLFASGRTAGGRP